MKFQYLWDGREFVPRMLCRILSKMPLEPRHLVCLSREALLYFLLDSDIAKESRVESVSFQEYLKLRNLILWWICQLNPKEAVEASVSHLPIPYYALRLLEEPTVRERHRPPTDASQFINSLLLKSPASLESVLSIIDLTRVHPELLFKVVEPLLIFPSCKMSDAYRLHSTRDHKIPIVPMLSVWEHGANCQTRTTTDGVIIEKVHKTYGQPYEFATCSIPLWRSYGIYEWDVVLETPGPDQPQGEFPVIGVVHEKDMQLGEPSDLMNDWGFGKKGSVFLLKQGQCWVKRHHDDGNAMVRPRKYGKRVSPDGFSSVRVHLNMWERTCKFSCEGQSFEDASEDLAFKNMPRGVYFLAVSLSAPKTEIKLVRGFAIS